MEIRLKELRKAAGYRTRKVFVDALGGDYTERKVKSWETGERMMSLAQACDIAELLRCTLDELAGRRVRPRAYADPSQAELNDCYERSTPDRRARLVESARDAALASGEAPCEEPAPDAPARRAV